LAQNQRTLKHGKKLSTKFKNCLFLVFFSLSFSCLLLLWLFTRYQSKYGSSFFFQGEGRGSMLLLRLICECYNVNCPHITWFFSYSTSKITILSIIITQRPQIWHTIIEFWRIVLPRNLWASKRVMETNKMLINSI